MALINNYCYQLYTIVFISKYIIIGRDMSCLSYNSMRIYLECLTKQFLNTKFIIFRSNSYSFDCFIAISLSKCKLLTSSVRNELTSAPFGPKELMAKMICSLDGL